MRHAAPFARVLDETLAVLGGAPGGRADSVDVTAAAGARPFRPAPVLGFFDFTGGTGQARPTRIFNPPHARAAGARGFQRTYASVQSGPAHTTSHNDTAAGPDPRVEPRCRTQASRQTPPRASILRRLSRRQHEALAELVALGAVLSTGFTAEELKSAHRMLAHRYHPDRHPHSTDADRATLAALFARAHEAYQVLQLAVSDAAVRRSPRA